MAIGRAIIRHPRIFLFDEPLSNLDAELRLQMRIEIARLHASLGNTMIYVTHDQLEAMTLADRIVVLRQGRIEQVGAPLTLYHVIERQRCADLLNAALTQHDDAVSQRHRLQLIVGDINHGIAERGVQPRNLNPHLQTQLGIEVRERLIEQENTRMTDNCPANRHAM